MKQRRRYLLFVLHCEIGIREDDLRRAVSNSISSLLGEQFNRPSIFRLISFDGETRLGVLRCDHRHIDPVRSALVYVREVTGSPATIWVLQMSGTLKSLRRTAKPIFIKQTG